MNNFDPLFIMGVSDISMRYHAYLSFLNIKPCQLIISDGGGGGVVPVNGLPEIVGSIG